MKTVSSKLSKQLKEAGCPQDSYLYWIKIISSEIYLLVFKYDETHYWAMDYNEWILEEQINEKNAAFLTDEILDLLPAFIANTWSLTVCKGPVVNTWRVGYVDEEYDWSDDKNFITTSLADAAAKTWLYLKEKGIS